MGFHNLLKLLIDYKIDDYVVYLGPKKDRSVIMKVDDIIDATYEETAQVDYELVLLEPNTKSKKDEIWAKYEEVRPLTKKEAKLVKILYD